MTSSIPTDRLASTAERLTAWIMNAATPTERSNRFIAITSDDHVEYGQTLKAVGADRRVLRIAEDQGRELTHTRSYLRNEVLALVDVTQLDQTLLKRLAARPVYDKGARAQCRHCGEKTEAAEWDDHYDRRVWIGAGVEDCDHAPGGYHSPPLV